MNFQSLILIKPRTTPTKSTVAFFSLSYPTVCTEAHRDLGMVLSSVSTCNSISPLTMTKRDLS